ncbi:TPA: hypothetical protein ACRMXN_005651 [Pseudomonas aeruginosa]|uniref:hypothetical protein n=1 Tax=Pseudomonas aeruginosa TaxID=287 RepID=UPI00192AB12F|nr:hypothetical protein [Pseudomonas aeruginosa]EIU3733322.1 hypothetical protein [Pseudomonas aeruginosa]EKV1279846.1 hypothetical protein [Pseudomonas aeruginosa]HBN8288575.1 hypothetical protein [Pseudomonas aeruginosa]
MAKPRSQTAAAKKAGAEQPVIADSRNTKPAKQTPAPAEIEALARELAGRPYGSKQPAKQKAKPVTISLPPSMIEQLEDAALRNKRENGDLKTVSAIVRDALEAKGYIVS